MRLLGLFGLTAILVSFCWPPVGELTVMFAPAKGGAVDSTFDCGDEGCGTAKKTPEA
jgi:hypothetical protein